MTDRLSRADTLNFLTACLKADVDNSGMETHSIYTTRSIESLKEQCIVNTADPRYPKRHFRSPCQVACESAKRFNPKATVVAHHGDVKTDEFGADFFKQFDVCLNALDNLGIGYTIGSWTI